MTSIRIAEVMTSDVLSVEPGLPFAETVSLMEERRVSCVPVVEKGKPVGVISERDVLRASSLAMQGEAFPERTSEIMSHPPITIASDASVDEAIAVVNLKRIRRLVVVGGGDQLVGLVTQSDLVAAQTMAVARERDLLEERVRVRTDELEKLSRRLERLSLADPMLGIGNRRAMEREMTHLHELARRYQRPYSVLLLDIDEFKKYNDHYGHPVADQILMQVCEATGSVLRTSDSLYRYGGEEFLICLPETDLDGAATTAERVRATVEEMGLPHDASERGIVTVSIGGSCEPAKGELSEWTVRVSEADEALYRAKEGGRNAVELHQA